MRSNFSTPVRRCVQSGPGSGQRSGPVQRLEARRVRSAHRGRRMAHPGSGSARGTAACPGQRHHGAPARPKPVRDPLSPSQVSSPSGSARTISPSLGVVQGAPQRRRRRRPDGRAAGWRGGYRRTGACALGQASRCALRNASGWTGWRCQCTAEHDAAGFLARQDLQEQARPKWTCRRRMGPAPRPGRPAGCRSVRLSNTLRPGLRRPAEGDTPSNRTRGAGGHRLAGLVRLGHGRSPGPAGCRAPDALGRGG